MKSKTKTTPESRNATPACPSGICGAIHSTLSPEQCGCKGCQEHLGSLAKSEPKSDLQFATLCF